MGNDTTAPSSEPRRTFSSGRDEAADAPDLRVLHYNDVYHVDPASAEPVGGLARFMTLVTEYRAGQQYSQLPSLVTLFSGDAFNPSLESSVTKGWSTCLHLAQLGLTPCKAGTWCPSSTPSGPIALASG